MVTGWKGLFRRRKSFIKITSILVSLHLLVIQTSFIAVAVILTGCKHNPVLAQFRILNKPRRHSNKPRRQTD